MQSVVEVVCVGGSGSNKTFNSVYSDPGVCKMVIVQDDDKFPSPRLCLLRRWPNFDGGFGFKLYEDLISSTGALKVEEVVRHSPAEAGGLRKNDVIIEINGDNIEFKSFFRLVEVLKEACARNKMELLVLAEQDAEWYRVRNITVNSHFPNIEYCETPYYGHILKPIDSVQSGPNQTKTGPSQIEFHSSSGKLYRTTLVIDRDRDSSRDCIYRRIEELPATSNAEEEVGTAGTAGSTIAPLRPDGTYRHPSSDPNGSVRVYYRRMNPTPVGEDQLAADSGHCTMADRLNATTTSPYSTLGKDNGERSVDLLHDKWGDLMDKYLDTKFKSADTGLGESQATSTFTDSQHVPDRDTTNTLKKSHVIKLHDPNMSSTMKRSRTQSPNDGTFSYLYSGRDDYQTAVNRQTSPYQRGSPYTQSHNRFTSPQAPINVVQSPTRTSVVRNQTQPPPNRHTNNQDTSISSYSTSYNQSQHQQQQQQLHANQHDSSTYTTSSLIHSTQRDTSPLANSISAATSGNINNNLINSTNYVIHSSSSGGGGTLSSSAKTPYNISIQQPPKHVSSTLGFKLDENEILQKGVYIVKYVEPNTPSAMAGLKEGDKITKINGKLTNGMPYDQFCTEIVIAQQQQIRNNMIHLMVMRKSAKSTGTSSYSAITSGGGSLSPSRTHTSSHVVPGSKYTSQSVDKNNYQSTLLTSSTSSNLNVNEKTSSFVDEGYVPGSATSATSSSTTTAIGSGPGSSSNLVSVVKITSPTYQHTEGQQQLNKASLRPGESPSYVSTYESTYVKHSINVIYDNSQEANTTCELKQKPPAQKPVELKPQYSTSIPTVSAHKREERERIIEQERIQREKEEAERLERERKEREERERAERLERERLERERLERERLQREREREEAERRERERVERLERERVERLERERKEREERERAERLERERKEREERERAERLERERKEREERERLERERLERERLEKERLERERLERERLQREREERERAERERLQREREERERAERERLQREREEREERERAERLERERLERERLQREREKRERLQKLEYERIERERLQKLEYERIEQERLEKQEQDRREPPTTKPAPSAVKDALAALTTIVVNSNSTEKLDDATEIPIVKSDIVYKQQPIPLVNESCTTTKITETYEIHRFNREEIVENPSSSKFSYEDQSGSLQKQLNVESEEDRARREYAEREFVRQQEVMGYLVQAMDNLKVDDKLRTYSLYTSEQFFGFGIAFHTESIPATLPTHKLVYPLVEIEPNSPADEAGMRNGQRVVAVNGEFVNREFKSLEDVVQAIEDSYYNRNFTDITVIDSELWTECMEDPNYAAQLAKHKVISEPVKHIQPIQPIQPVQPIQPIQTYDKSAPRFCHLVRTSRTDQYGFDFKTLKTEGRHIANNVRPGLPADKAGLRDGDFILEVNGESLEGMEHDAVVNKISNNPTQVDLLVVGDINSYLASKKVDMAHLARLPPPTHDEIDIDLRLPNIVYHRVNLVPGFKGLGISLTPNGVISAIEPNSPSDRAGLRIGDRIVEVNGVDVRDKSNREIAKIIKENENDLVIGVLTNADQLHVLPTPSPPVHDTPGSSNLKSIIAEAIKPTHQHVVPQPQPLPQPLPPTQPIVSENMPNIKSIIADVINMQAPDNVNLNKATPTKYSRDLSIEPTEDEILGARICQLIRNEDYDGFGFSMRANDKGPHQVSSVEPNSPAERGGLRTDDLILKVNDINVVGERYSKTVAQIKNESERGILKLEVIDPYQCPPSIKNTLLAPSAYSTMSKGIAGSRPLSDSTQNLRNITREAINTDVSNRSRAVSVDTGSERMRPPRPLSANDIDINQNSTVRSYGSAMTGLSESGPNLMNQSSRSMGTLPSKYDKPKFKRCSVNLTPESDNFGFTLNSRIKPKYMIYDVAFNSPAYMANLRTNDVIVEIDGKNIRRLKFDKVKEMLNQSKQKRHVEVLAITKEGYLYYKNKKKRFSSNKLVTQDNTELFPNANISSSYGGGNFGTFNKSQSPTMSLGDRAQQGVVVVEPTATITSTTSNRLISASSTRFDQPQPTTISATAQLTSPPPPQIEQPENMDIVIIELNRKDASSPLGLSLANQANKTLSKSSGVSFKDDPLLLPVITKVDPDSPAEQAGLRAGDSVLEINGKPTNGLQNPAISSLIKSSGNNITFTVSRKRSAEELIRESAARITQQTIQDAQLRVNEYDTRELVDATPILPSSSSQTRLSRRDQASPSVNSLRSSPKIVHEEIRMSSSKLHDVYSPQPSQASPSPRLRNQSEPAPAHTAVQQLPLQTSTDLNKSVTSDTFQSSPISRRSSSSYTLPPDAPIPRLCRVRAYENQLGFTIAGSRSNRGVFKISDITPNSPAAHSGLQNDDYIIEISGMNVESKDYGQVVDFIKAKKEEDDLQLLVADRATLLWYKSKHIPISSQVVPKMQYIETLLKDEIDREKENYE